VHNGARYLILFVLVLFVMAFVGATARADWTPPIGVPVPPWGMTQTHMMYAEAGQTYNYGSGAEPYRIGPDGPYTHYIDNTDPNATDASNPYGTVAKPRLNLPDMRYLAAGSVVQIRGGPYGVWGQVAAQLFVEATAEKPIFIRGSVGDRPVMHHTWFFECSYHVVENIEWDFDQQERRAVYFGAFGNARHHVAVRNCLFHNMKDVPMQSVSAIRLRNNENNLNVVENILIYNNAFYNLGKDRVTAVKMDHCGLSIDSNVQNVWIVDNEFHHIGGDGLQVSCDYPESNHVVPNHIYIGRNTFHDNYENALDLKKCTDVVISQNTAYNFGPGYGGSSPPFRYGMGEGHLDPGRRERIWTLFNRVYNSTSPDGAFLAFSDESDCVEPYAKDIYFIGNLVYNCHSEAGDAAAFVKWNQESIYYINNTVWNCDTGFKLSMERRRTWTIDETPYSEVIEGTVLMVNNIVGDMHNGAQSPWNYHLMVSGTETSHAKMSMSNNLFYDDDGVSSVKRSVYDDANDLTPTSTDYTVTQWIEAHPTQSVGFVQGDPLLRNPAGADFRLTSDSAAVGAGTASETVQAIFDWYEELYGVDISYDFAGNRRSLPWDIGAYEYGAVIASYTVSITATNGSVAKVLDKDSYMHDESVTLTATPASGYRFVNWSGDLSGSSNPATLVMDGSKSVTALFASNVHTLTISATGGTVTKSPDKASYEYGESVTLTASADAGYSFTGWSGAASGTNSSVTITMDGDKSVTANFAAISYTLSIAAANGSVVANPQKAGYSYGESVSLQAVPSTGYHFTGWSGSLSGSSNPASIVMNADKSVTAAFDVNTYTLTTSATNGSVVRNPQAASYTHGSTVSLQAVAAEGYQFAGWSGAVSGSTNPVEIVMDSSKSVTAAFTVNTYTLTTSATNGSVVRSPESATYTHGSTVSVQAVAAEGYHFTGWSGAVSGSSNPVSLVMDSSKSVTAAFAANAYTLSISASNGTVTASPNQATYTHGEVVTLTAAPSTGYSFSSWSGDASGTAASTTVTMDGNKSVTAAFALNTYTLSVSSANGTVTRDPVQATYTHGQTVTLTAVPATGYSFSSWSGDLSGTAASATITMDGDKSVAAGFTINSYTLNTSGANGSITKNPDKGAYNHGETVTLQAVPAEGYNFVNWSGDLAGSANPATLVMDSNKTVAAAFAANTYTLQTNATNGSVTRTPDQASFTFGETVTLTAVPGIGYSFSGWSGDASGSTATVTITMNADKSVTAGFIANAYTLSVSASNGSVTVNPSRETYAHGEVVTLTAVPSVGYSFSSWSGDASGTATSTTVTMDSNKSVTAAFTLNTYTLSVTSANGTVTKNPNQATFNHGDTVALTAESAEGYEFAGWSGDLTGTSNPATLTMTSNKSVTAHFTAVSNDNEAPVLFGFSPLADAIQVPLNSLVLLRITDSGDGVDANTVSIEVNGDLVYAGNVASASGVHGVCRRVGTPAHYVYAFQPVEDFDYDSTVAVTVNAADLAGNAMAEQSYSFRTQMRTFGSNHCASWGPDGLDKGGAATVCDAGGNVWVVWHAGDAGSRDIYIARLTSGVEQFSGPIQLTSNASDQCNPDIAIGPDGRLFVVWQDNRRGNWDIYLRTSADGVTWSSEIEATDFSNDETNPVIAVDARSPSYAFIAWQDNRAGNQDIYVASSSTNFASKTVARVTSNVQDQIGPRIAVDGANGVYLVWTDFRNGAADVYGAASSSGPWTNVAVATGLGSQSAPDIAAEPGGYSLHFVWVNRVDNQDDVFYGTSIGLPASPLAGINIIDDTSFADQRTPAIVAAGSGGTARVFAAWQDFRNAADGLDTDLYAAEIKDGSVTNLFVGDGWTRTNQTEPCIGVDLFGRPYVVWTDERNAKDEIYFAASTFVEATPLDVRMVVGATGGTVGVASPTQLDDVSVVIPAGACPYDVIVSIARIWNLEPGLPADILPYEFGPSGLQFEAPVTITIPYAVADYPGAPPQPYWYDAMTGAMSQQGITNIQYVVLSSTLHALRFQTTHFTPYAVVGEVEEGVTPAGGSGGGGGGCSLSPVATGASGVLEYFVPFTVLALAMIGLRIKDKRRHSKPQ